ncbi:MAG: M48 family metalloprotease [Myxococcales bacterium]|nr:M48 family metalloprotease [Myxococcales bacterium]
MNLLAASYVLAAMGALATAPIVAATQGAMLRQIDGLAPGSRARWITVLLALPWIVGLAIVAVTLGHCVVPMWFGAVDDCVPGVGVCVRDGAPVGRATLLFAVLVSLRPAHALWRAVTGVIAARRAAKRLRAIGVESAEHDGWTVPGTTAAMLGFPREELFVGEALHEALSEQELAAVVAHERAHKERNDVLRRMLARVLASAHFDATGRELVEALDLAIEQRCDEHASEQVRDPLVVARALVQAATLEAKDAKAPAPQSLPARVAALCAPSWIARPALVSFVAAAGVALALAAAASAHEVHTVAESILAAIARA